jgi:hypothetical protein
MPHVNPESQRSASAQNEHAPRLLSIGHLQGQIRAIRYGQEKREKRPNPKPSISAASKFPFPHEPGAIPWLKAAKISPMNYPNYPRLRPQGVFALKFKKSIC